MMGVLIGIDNTNEYPRFCGEIKILNICCVYSVEMPLINIFLFLHENVFLWILTGIGIASFRQFQ